MRSKVRQRRFKIAAKALATKTLRVIRCIANIYDGGCIPIDAEVRSIANGQHGPDHPQDGFLIRPARCVCGGTKAVMGHDISRSCTLTFASWGTGRAGLVAVHRLCSVHQGKEDVHILA